MFRGSRGISFRAYYSRHLFLALVSSVFVRTCTGQSCDQSLFHCDQCLASDSLSCARCRNAQFLAPNATCVGACPVGYVEIGSGDFDRRCESHAPTTTPSVPPTPAPALRTLRQVIHDVSVTAGTSTQIYYFALLLNEPALADRLGNTSISATVLLPSDDALILENFTSPALVPTTVLRRHILEGTLSPAEFSTRNQVVSWSGEALDVHSEIAGQSDTVLIGSSGVFTVLRLPRRIVARNGAVYLVDSLVPAPGTSVASRGNGADSGGGDDATITISVVVAVLFVVWCVLAALFISSRRTRNKRSPGTHTVHRISSMKGRKPLITSMPPSGPRSAWDTGSPSSVYRPQRWDQDEPFEQVEEDDDDIVLTSSRGQLREAAPTIEELLEHLPGSAPRYMDLPPVGTRGSQRQIDMALELESMESTTPAYHYFPANDKAGSGASLHPAPKGGDETPTDTVYSTPELILGLLNTIEEEAEPQADACSNEDMSDRPLTKIEEAVKFFEDTLSRPASRANEPNRTSGTEHRRNEMHLV